MNKGVQAHLPKKSVPSFADEPLQPEALHAVKSISLFKISADGKKSVAINPLNDLSHKAADRQHNVIIEIPGGTLQKTEMDDTNGRIIPDVKKGKIRHVDFLPYPTNYGSIPQTISSKAKGGDGDPIDLFMIGPKVPRGHAQPVRVIGGIDMQDDGERDIKLIGLTANGPFAKIKTLDDLQKKHPGVVDILETWLRSYKGPNGGIEITGRLNEKQAHELIEEGHQDWLKEKKKPLNLNG
jgi:inorganic pyrophosphatase